MNQNPYQSPPPTNRPWLPVWGILSVAAAPGAIVLAAGVTFLMESIFGRPLSESATLPAPVHQEVGRILFGAMRIFALAGVAAAFISLVSRERPRWLPFIGLLTTAIFVGLLLSDAD
jgi:hypothetical protein